MAVLLSPKWGGWHGVIVKNRTIYRVWKEDDWTGRFCSYFPNKEFQTFPLLWRDFGHSCYEGKIQKGIYLSIDVVLMVTLIKTSLFYPVRFSWLPGGNANRKRQNSLLRRNRRDKQR